MPEYGYLPVSDDASDVFPSSAEVPIKLPAPWDNADSSVLQLNAAKTNMQRIAAEHKILKNFINYKF